MEIMKPIRFSSTIMVTQSVSPTSLLPMAVKMGLLISGNALSLLPVVEILMFDSSSLLAWATLR